MAEKFVQLLKENGVEAEIIRWKPTILSMNGKEYWFRKTGDDVSNKIPDTVTEHRMPFVFACVHNNDYENALYLTGSFDDLLQYQKEDGDIFVGQAKMQTRFGWVVGKV